MTKNTRLSCRDSADACSIYACVVPQHLVKRDRKNATSTANTAAIRPESTVADADLAKGKELYNKNCVNCHKETGEGGPTVVDGRKLKPDNLTDDRRKRLNRRQIYRDDGQGRRGRRACRPLRTS